MASEVSSNGDGDGALSYIELPLEEACKELGHYTHASHVMLYAEWPGALWGKYPFHYAIMVSLINYSQLHLPKHRGIDCIYN